MQKVIYLLWSGTDELEFSETLRLKLVPNLLDCQGILGVQLNLVDQDVALGAKLRIVNSESVFNAMCSVYIDDVEVLPVIDAHVQSYSSHYHRYDVNEIERLPNTTSSAGFGLRTPGFSQVALLRCPQRLGYKAWLDYWQNIHTNIALETQSTFRYVQNIVNGVKQDGIASCHAIVEECFPIQAMTDQSVFYNAVDDISKQQSNMTKMIDSCAKFIDFDEIDVVLTSEYCFYNVSELNLSRR
ncbi:Uncharacterised protein [Zhongshania aliphaticivorans]|uniref:Uncharacterized protein n=1 Tax=Zhongshania aliphaticivorans TaxID=1470434 RepID=A0A5S9NAS4_9GAMM|nr:EthD domain-containing protein [Zhongshania aliphaticivorans]CAA0087274.1 Uncharacterised protein [Zhongshania aliphaticivorans]CAA0114452.1 Uncharacterised protein [Zhongshania aliphaticivorans]